MNGYILSPDARQDIFQIWSYLAEEVGVAFADQLEAELFGDFSLLASTPGLGHKREDLTRLPVLFYRAFPYQYMVIYRQKPGVEIVRVLHARRNVKKILGDRK